MMADYWLLGILVEKYCVDRAGLYASAAADAFVCVQVYAAAFALCKRVRGAGFGTGCIFAGVAYCFHKFAGNAAVCSDFNCALMK